MLPLQPPLELAPQSIAAERRLFLKREDVHELGAFKWRGALPALEDFRSRGARGVVTASTGNQGAATAWGASRLGLEAVVFAPVAASRTKLAVIEGFGADVRLVGADLDEEKDSARGFAGQCGFAFFEDGSEPAQYRGYGAIAEEILEQLGQAPSTVVVPIGNGALVGGIGEALRRREAATQVVGVVAKGAPVMALSWEAGRPVECRRMNTFADGLAVRVAIPYAVDVLRRVVDQMLYVTDRELAHAISAFHSVGIRAEGAAAAGLASLAQIGNPNGATIMIVTGRNIDEELHSRALREPESFPV